MKKLLLCTIMLGLAPVLSALEIGNVFTYNSRFWDNSAVIAVRPFYVLQVTPKFSVTEHDDFKNHIYTASIPIKLQLNWFSASLTPFYIPGNGNGTSSYGANSRVSFKIKEDDIDKIKSFMYFGAGFSEQKADITRNGIMSLEENYKELVYELGISYNFFDVYGIDLSGNVFHYPEGVSNIDYIRSSMNQQLLANLSSTDYIMGLPKASGGVSLFWHSEESQSDNYISYRYIDFHDRKYIHSVMASTNINVGEKVMVKLSYNHIFIDGETDRDIFSGGASVRF